jgi:hypothetical protein
MAHTLLRALSEDRPETMNHECEFHRFQIPRITLV